MRCQAIENMIKTNGIESFASAAEVDRGVGTGHAFL